jgi:hypothetical protein
MDSLINYIRVSSPIPPDYFDTISCVMLLIAVLLKEGTSALKLCKYLKLGRGNLELGKGKIRHVSATPKTCGNYAATAIQLPNMRKRRVD